MCDRSKSDTRLAAVILASLLFAATAAADPPDVLRNYRLIPRHSTLEVSGGFAGIDWNYDLSGRFGLVIGYDYSPLAIYPPIIIPHAEFTDVRVQAMLNHPTVDAFPVPFDQFVDLEELAGTFHDPNLLLFRGEDQQAALFQLRATIVGRLIHLTGRNDPPCCDFFNYRIDAYAHLAPFADFNFDGAVDAADYTSWRNHVGMMSNATLEQGDADGDGDVDSADYDVWRQDLGTAIDMSLFAESDSATVAVVPEPSTFALLACGVFFFLGLSQWLSRRAG
jgi:Dockerin type I domain